MSSGGGGGHGSDVEDAEQAHARECLRRRLEDGYQLQINLYYINVFVHAIILHYQVILYNDSQLIELLFYYTSSVFNHSSL